MTAEIKKVLILDGGSSLSLALELCARDDLEVYYFSGGSGDEPKIESQLVGFGFDRFGLHLVKDFYSLINTEEDKDSWVILITDPNFGDLAKWLRDDGWSVFGPDKKAMELETKYEVGKDFVQGLGVDVPAFQDFPNLEELSKGLDTFDPAKRYVLKINSLSGPVETLVGTPEEITDRLRGISSIEKGMNLGCTLEEYLPGVPVATAAFFNGEKFLTPVLRIYDSPWGGYLSWYNRCLLFEMSLRKLEIGLKRIGFQGIVNLNGYFIGKGVWGEDNPAKDTYASFGLNLSGAYPWARVCFKMIDNLWEMIDSTAKQKNREAKLLCKDAFFINAFRGGNLEDFYYLGDIWKLERDNPKHYGIAFDNVTMDSAGDVSALPGHDRVFQMIGFGNSYGEAVKWALSLLQECQGRIDFKHRCQDLIEDMRDRDIFTRSWLGDENRD